MQRKHERENLVSYIPLPISKTMRIPVGRANSNASKTNISTPSRFSRTTGHAERLLFEIKIQYYPVNHVDKYSAFVHSSNQRDHEECPESSPKLCVPINLNQGRRLGEILEERFEESRDYNRIIQGRVVRIIKRDDILLEIKLEIETDKSMG